MKNSDNGEDSDNGDSQYEPQRGCELLTNIDFTIKPEPDDSDDTNYNDMIEHFSAERSEFSDIIWFNSDMGYEFGMRVVQLRHTHDTVLEFKLTKAKNSNLPSSFEIDDCKLSFLREDGTSYEVDRWVHTSVRPYGYVHHKSTNEVCSNYPPAFEGSRFS